MKWNERLPRANQARFCRFLIRLIFCLPLIKLSNPVPITQLEQNWLIKQDLTSQSQSQFQSRSWARLLVSFEKCAHCAGLVKVEPISFFEAPFQQSPLELINLLSKRALKNENCPNNNGFVSIFETRLTTRAVVVAAVVSVLVVVVVEVSYLFNQLARFVVRADGRRARSTVTPPSRHSKGFSSVQLRGGGAVSSSCHLRSGQRKVELCCSQTK